MKKDVSKLGSVLTKCEQQYIQGGANEFYCTCNGTYVGTASSALGCAALCSQCIENGGCAEEAPSSLGNP